MFKKPCTSNLNKKRLVSTLMSTHPSSENAGQMFQLKSSKEFESRLNSVFDNLKSVEAEHEKWQSRHERNLDMNKGDVTKRSIKRSRAFKKYMKIHSKRGPQPRPDYLIHPNKWKKYSLRDVPTHTDELNTAVAMQFLQDVKSRDNEQGEETVNEKVIFKKPFPVDKQAVKKTKTASKHQYCSCSTSAFKMPEYVVGEKVPKPVKPKKPCSVPLSTVKLPHLESTSETD